MRLSFLLLGIASWFLTSLPCSANPVFTLDSQATFQAAIDSGLLAPIVAWDSTLEDVFPGQQPNFQAATLSTNSQGLAVNFTDSLPTVIFGELYTYGTDPDLTNAKITKTVTVPFMPNAATATVSFILTDTNGKNKAWTVNVFPGGTVMPDFMAAGGQQGANGFAMDAGFDISKVTIIRDAYMYNNPKAGGGKAAVAQSNLAVSIVPEPSSRGLMLVAILFVLVPISIRCYSGAEARRRTGKIGN